MRASKQPRDQRDELKAEGITHIVCVRQADEALFVRVNFPDDFEYLVLEIGDVVQENIIRYFPRVCAFLDDCLAQGGRALLHGNAGLSRSGALLIAYLMQRHQLTFM